MGWCPSGLLVHLPVLPSFYTRKSRRWRTNIQFVGITPWVPPHADANTRWGNPARTQHNPVLGCRVVNDDLRADGLWKRWGFRVSTWNVDSLTVRAGEVVEALSERKVDIAFM